MKLFDSLALFTDNDPKSAALNMALDEALLENCDRPTLRIYRWRAPSISIGYFSRYSDVAESQSTHDLVRRWTGGGIVPHGLDFTYSIFLPATHALFARSSMEIYSTLHGELAAALRKIGLDAGLTSGSAPKISDACFANPVRADVMLGGKKIAGAAHRRTRLGLLHQGSVQLENLPASFSEILATTLCDSPQPNEWSASVLQRASELAAEKYGTVAWLRRRE